MVSKAVQMLPYAERPTSIIKVAIPTSNYIGYNPRTNTGRLAEILEGVEACGIDIRNLVVSGSTSTYRKGQETGEVQVVHKPARDVPSNIALANSYVQRIHFGFTGRDHWVETFLELTPLAYETLLSESRFKQMLRRKGVHPLAYVGLSPVSHIVAKPAGSPGNPLESEWVTVSTEYPKEFAAFCLHKYKEDPLTLILRYPDHYYSLDNDIEGKDRRTVEILVTSGQTESSGGVIADITQSGQSLKTKNYEPIQIIAQSTPLLAVSIDAYSSNRALCTSLTQAVRAAEARGNERYPEFFESGFEKEYPELVRGFARMSREINHGSNGNGATDDPNAELFSDIHLWTSPIPTRTVATQQVNARFDQSVV